MSDDETSSPEESAEAEIEERPSFEGQIVSNSNGEGEEYQSEYIYQAAESE